MDLFQHGGAEGRGGIKWAGYGRGDKQAFFFWCCGMGGLGGVCKLQAFCREG